MRAVLALCVPLVACGGGKRDVVSPADVPPPVAHPATAGNALLPAIPAGADAVIEIDLARLRANGVVGPVLAAIPRRETSGDAALAFGATGDLGFDPLADVDLFVAAAYRVGRPDAATIFLLRGQRVDAARAAATIPMASVIDEHTISVQAPEAALPAAGFLAGDRRLAGDDELMRLREEPMPAGATGAAVRLTARLSVDGRIAAAAQLGLDELPATLGIWGDVADDLALVALLSADDAAGAQRLADGYPAWETRVGRFFRSLGMPTPAAGARLARQEDQVRITWVVGPRMLSEWAASLRRRLGRP
jgi:hypothetical protein